MPLSKHYQGSGEKVMRKMKKKYGAKKGKEVFYATENKQKQGGNKADKVYSRLMGRK